MSQWVIPYWIDPLVMIIAPKIYHAPTPSSISFGYSTHFGIIAMGNREMYRDFIYLFKEIDGVARGQETLDVHGYIDLCDVHR